MFGEDRSGGQDLVANEALVSSGGGARMGPGVGLKLCSRPGAFPAVSALQVHGSILAPPLLGCGAGGARGAGAICFGHVVVV